MDGAAGNVRRLIVLLPVFLLLSCSPSAPTGASGALAAPTIVGDYIQIDTTGERCGYQNLGGKYFARNTHPTETLRARIQETSRPHGGSSGTCLIKVMDLAPQARGAPDRPLGCNIPGPTAQTFEWYKQDASPVPAGSNQAWDEPCADAN